MKQRSEKSQSPEKLGPTGGQNVIAPSMGSAASASQTRNQSDSLTSELMERVCDRNNLNQAFQRVKSNKGSAGVDQMTVDQLGPWISVHKRQLIESLLNGSHTPQAVRRVEIPKPDGGMRTLGSVKSPTNLGPCHRTHKAPAACSIQMDQQLGFIDNWLAKEVFSAHL